jgi:caffeoyl-CoA O-methyltransferase
MARSPELLPAAVAAYSDAHTPAEDESLRWLAERTAALGSAARMQVSASQGVFLGQLVRIARPRLVVEVGTFTGYSALCMARALPQGGRLVCFDLSEEWTTLAREAWDRAGIADRVELRIGPAAETLGSLEADGPVDFVFIDADKPGYTTYWDLLVPRLSPGGLVVADNVLQGGAVADPDDRDANVEAIRAFNDKVAADPRMETLLLPVYDGLTVAIRK